MTAPKRPSILDFEDYRIFLTAWFAVRPMAPSKKTFAERAGCSSATISLVLQGKRNLSHELARKFLETLDRTQALSAEEWEAFPLMVQVNQSEEGELPAQQRELKRLRALHRSRPMSAARFDVFSDRTLPVVFELARCVNFRESGKWIASKLRHPVEEERAEWALKRLQDLGLLQRMRDGRLSGVAETLIGRLLTPDTAEERALKNQALRTMHRRVVEEGWEALQTIHHNERHFGTSTIAINSEQLPELRAEIERFEQRLLAMSDSATARDRVYQFNIQFFPVSHTTRDKTE